MMGVCVSKLTNRLADGVLCQAKCVNKIQHNKAKKSGKEGGRLKRDTWVDGPVTNWMLYVRSLRWTSSSPRVKAVPTCSFLYPVYPQVTLLSFFSGCPLSALCLSLLLRSTNQSIGTTPYEQTFFVWSSNFQHIPWTCFIFLTGGFESLFSTS